MATPAELEALANRIDHEELWRWAGMDRDKMTPEQKDRMWAGVHLRRYAHDRGNMLEQLKEGAMYLRGMRLERANRGTDQRGCGDHAWHVAINAESDRLRAEGAPWPQMMYAAMKISDEVPRMVLLFQYERERGMPDSYKMCGLDPRPATKLVDNHLRCALGQECRKCPYLAAIDRSEKMTPEAKDEAKAWTCATHFLLESESDAHFETILRDKSDDAFDARMVESFGAGYDDGSLGDGPMMNLHGGMTGHKHGHGLYEDNPPRSGTLGWMSMNGRGGKGMVSRKGAEDDAQMVKDCMDRESKLTEWEATFIDSLNDQIVRGLLLSTKQRERLGECWSRVTGEAPATFR